MPDEKHVLKLLTKKSLFLPLVYVAAILCLLQPTAAQSGRNRNKNVTPAAPSSVPELPTATTDVDADTPAVQRDVKISSILVFGESRNNSYLFSRSNYIDSALKECFNNLNDRSLRTGLNVVKGGKLNIEAAKTRAKHETDAYVLWIGLAMKDDGYGNALVDYIDYVVLMPQTSKFLTSGRVNPSQTTIPGQGTVLRVPSVSSGRASPTLQIKSAGREIIQRLLRGGWID